MKAYQPISGEGLLYLCEWELYLIIIATIDVGRFFDQASIRFTIFHRPLLLCCMDPTALLSAALFSVTLLSDAKNLRRLALCAFVLVADKNSKKNFIIKMLYTNCY